MKTKILIKLFVITLATAGLFIFAHTVFSQDIDSINYPVVELGNCKDKAACKIYCDNPENADACINFAEKNNLMSVEEIKNAKSFIAAGSKGPGGCVGKDACEQYCDEMNHIDECISFAEKNNLMPPAELEEAKKVQAAIAKGVKPPPCKNKTACDIYCEDSAHMEECISFAEAAGFMQGEELKNAQKMLQAIKKGVKPPPCKGKDACDEYCGEPANMEVCMNFALEAGFMSEQEKSDSQKMLQAIKKGIKPPNCKSKEACDAYCGQDDHFEECANFAEAAGFMTAEEATMVRKTGGKGPGGCKHKEECEAFCKNSDNQETCFNFAKDNGMIPEADLKQMEQGRQQLQQSLQQAPKEVINCLQSEIGVDMVKKMENGIMPSKEMGDKMKECFQEMGPSQGAGGPGAGGMIPPKGQTGPGGCKTAEECRDYCRSHPQECGGPQTPSVRKGQDGPGTMGIPGGSVPGGCSNPGGCPNLQQPPVGSEVPAGSGGEGYRRVPPPCADPAGCQQIPVPGQQPLPGEISPLIPAQPQPSVPFEQPQLPSAPSASPIPPVIQQPPTENITPPPSSFLRVDLLVGSIIKSYIKFFIT